MNWVFKLILIPFLIFHVSFAENLYIKDTKVKNLPKEYIEVFSEFLLKTLENAYPYDYYNSTGYILVPYLSWIGISYNTCFDVYQKDYLVSMGCFSSISGQDIIQDISILEKKFTFLKFKKKEKKEIALKFKITTKPIVERLKIISPKGDILVSYVPIVYKSSNDNIIDLGTGNLNLDTLILNYSQSKKLFEMLLNNYKVKEILIIK